MSIRNTLPPVMRDTLPPAVYMKADDSPESPVMGQMMQRARHSLYGIIESILSRVDTLQRLHLVLDGLNFELLPDDLETGRQQLREFLVSKVKSPNATYTGLAGYTAHEFDEILKQLS